MQLLRCLKKKDPKNLLWLTTHSVLNIQLPVPNRRCMKNDLLESSFLRITLLLY